MKKTWKSILGAAMCAVAVISSTYTVPLSSQDFISKTAEPIDGNIKQYANEVSPHVEETTWCFRTYNGKLQKRLWSNTEGKWLTDWIDCN